MANISLGWAGDKAQAPNLVSLGTCYHGNQRLDNSEETYAGAHSKLFFLFVQFHLLLHCLLLTQ